MDPSSIASDVAETAAHVGGSLLDEIKNIGQTAVSQVIGNQPQTPTADDVAKLDKKDQKFSKEAQAEIQARIQEVYEEYAAKRKKEEMLAKQQVEAVVAQKKELEEVREKEIDQANPATAKTRAEIKNYGAE